MKNMDNKFIFTEEQQEAVCKHFGEDIEELEFWEICKLLDKVIDNLAIQISVYKLGVAFATLYVIIKQNKRREQSV